MPNYAVAHFRSVTMGPAVVEYLERIDATLHPFGGRFIVHGGNVEVIEGAWPGNIVIIEFPDRARARAWYDSPAYRAILRLRTDNVEGDVIIAEGVPAEYHATDILKKAA